MSSLEDWLTVTKFISKYFVENNAEKRSIGMKKSNFTSAMASTPVEIKHSFPFPHTLAFHIFGFVAEIGGFNTVVFSQYSRMLKLMSPRWRIFIQNIFLGVSRPSCLEVVLADFFLGDQFTSQVLVFRNFEFIACYYSRGFYLTKEDQACKRNPVYQGFGYVVAMLPFWWRFIQCLRRSYDEEDKHQLQNAGKYMTAIVAMGLRQAYITYRQVNAIELPVQVLFTIASTFATMYSSYWDFCFDWGLLKSQSKNKWLRFLDVCP